MMLFRNMEIIAIAFHLFSFFLAVLAAALLLWVNQERKHSNRLLAFILLLFAGQNLIHILLFSKLILSAPWLLRTFAPTTFLLGPVVFIYVRSVLKDEIKFRKYDWLLLIPGILTIINFIPYYKLPEIEKLNYLNEHFYSQKPSQDSGRGILPTTTYYIIRVCWSGIFLFFTFRMISGFRGKNTPEFLANNKILLNWLFTFNCILFAAWTVTFFNIFSPGLNSILPRIINVLFGATIFFICLQLFIRPQILYGVFQPLSNINLQGKESVSRNLNIPDSISALDKKEIPQNEPAEASLNISRDDQLRYKTLIEQYLIEKKPFLKTTYSLEDLVIDTQIPRYILSAFINREYGMGFREFLNRHRVDFFKNNINKRAWENLTLEAIAEECGFQSRSTFINNFKKITGLTPSEYLKNKN
jgi:AraC-like DNA-binding protein